MIVLPSLAGVRGEEPRVSGTTIARAVTRPAGYWIVASDGGIAAFGDATWQGSPQPLPNSPIVGIASTPSGSGYWLVGSDGGIFTYGDATYYGSTGAMHLARPIVGIAATPSGRGYWLVGSDGGIFTYGDATYFGSTGAMHLARPIVGIAATPSGRGYWLVGSDGGIFTYGDATYLGSTGGAGVARPIVGIAPARSSSTSGTNDAPTPTTSPSGPIYSSRNLAGHETFAESNPGGTSSCPAAGPDDVALAVYPDHAEVQANPRRVRTWLNALSFKRFIETFPSGQPIGLSTYRYRISTRTPVLPAATTDQSQNSQAAHVMIQLWDGRNGLWMADHKTLEATIFWELNAWVSDYGHIKVYTDPAYTLVDTGIVVFPDTAWHTFEVVADFASRRYVSISIDGRTVDLSNIALLQVAQPSWGTDVSLNITAESEPTWPGESCDRTFFWIQEYRDAEFSAI